MAGAVSDGRRAGAAGSALHAAPSAAADAPAVTARILAARYQRRRPRGRSPSAAGAPLHGRGDPRAGRAQSAGPTHRAAAGACGTNGPGQATWCIWMSNRSPALLGVGHRIHGDRRRSRSRASAGNTRTSPSMTTVGPPTSKSCPIKPGPRRRAFSPGPSHWFARRGVRLTRILTDNGGNYRSRRFHTSRPAHQVRYETQSRPYRPQTNGKAERFIQTLIREWAYARPYAHLGSPHARPAAVAPHLQHHAPAHRASAINHRAPAFQGSRSEQPC